jgi:hypothetical protein
LDRQRKIWNAPPALGPIDPESEDYLDKLGHLEGAVATHVYREESGWFVDLKERAPEAD